MQTESFKDFKQQYEQKKIDPPNEKTFSDQFKDNESKINEPEEDDDLQDLGNIELNDIDLFDTQQSLSVDIVNDDIKSEIVNTETDIIKLNEEIANLNVFKKYMQDKGYNEISNRFLAKNFAEANNPDQVYSVNITINNGIVTAITAYDQNNKVVKMPDSIITTVKNDINDSISAFI